MSNLGRLKTAAWLVVATLVGCAANTGDSSPDDPASDTDNTQDQLLAGRVIPESEVASLLRDAGFDEDAIPQMVCTAKWESSFYERAYHKNNNGTADRGLFQINSDWIGKAGCPKTSDGLYDAKANTSCARAVFAAQGIRAWYGYKKHKAECDAYTVAE